MKRWDRAFGVLLPCLFLVPTLARAAATVRSVDQGVVVLDGAGKVSPGTVFEVKGGDDLLGFLLAEQHDDSGVRIKLIAGRAAPGAEAIPIERPKLRVGFLGDQVGRQVQRELTVLCPNRVVDLQSTAELETGQLDAAVITSTAAEQSVRQFVERGGTAFVDLAVYAAWCGTKPKEAVSEKPLRVEVVGSSDVTRGLDVGERFAHCGSRADGYVCRYLEDVREGGRVLLAVLPDRKPVALEHRIGKGRLLALDLLSPNGEPGYDSGAVLKWILPGNLLANSVRYVWRLSAGLEYDVATVHELGNRLKHDDYMKLQEAVAERVRGKWVREKVGVDSGGKTIWRFRMGSLERPSFFFDGAIHGAEWLNPYLLLDLIEYLANVPAEDYKTRWIVRNYDIAIVPMLSGSMRQESFADCDLNRNFDFRWEDYTKGYGWREGRALKLRGTAPFSEPEARVVRDHIWNHPVIGYANTHMHEIKHGPMFMSPHILADPDQGTFSAATAVLEANLLDRFLWKGPSQQVFKCVANRGGRAAPYAGSWTAYQGLWSLTTELVGGSDHSVQQKELGFEGLLAFMQAVGVDYAAGKRRWLGFPRTGFARPGGYKDATSLIFTEGGKQTITYRTNRGAGTLRLPLPSAGCRLTDEAGESVEWTTGDDQCVLPMCASRYFFECGQATRQQVLDALKKSTFHQKQEGDNE